MAGDEQRRQKKLAKKAAKRKTKLVDRQRGPSARRSEPTRIISYEISREPMPELAYARLPEQVKDQLETLHHKMPVQNPEKALNVLKPLIEQYPDVPPLYNYLYIAYQKLGDRANAQRILQKTLERFPDYLFGRISYAINCLERGDAEKVPEIFGGKYELKLLYPRRKRFHLSEVLSFYAVMAWYFHTLEEHNRAETYYELMRQLEPKHRSTRFIKRLLHPSWFRKLFQRRMSKES
jgi:tetratricopeptide (TPR) repeat protein